jgi:WD40 repeat protein
VFQSEGRWAARFLASSDGRTLAAFHPQAGLWLFDMATREFVGLSREASLWPEFFSADSRTLFVRGAVTSNGVLPLLRWDMSAPDRPPETAWLHLPQTNSQYHAAASSDGRLYALNQSGSNAISLWNPRTGESAGQLRAPPNEWIGSPLCFSPDDRKLVTSVWPDTIRLIEMAAPERQWTARLPGRVGHVAFSPDGKILSATCDDHNIRLFDADTLKEVAVLPGHQSIVVHLAWSPDGRTLASADGGDVVKLWCMAARREVATVVRGNCGNINTLGFTPDGNTLWAGSWSGQIRLWRVPTLAELDRVTAR